MAREMNIYKATLEDGEEMYIASILKTETLLEKELEGRGIKAVKLTFVSDAYMIDKALYVDGC